MSQEADTTHDNHSAAKNRGVIDYRVEAVESAVKEIRVSLRGIHESMQTLIRLEERNKNLVEAQERLFSQMGKLEGHVENNEKRIGAIDNMLPTLQLTSRWILGAVGCVAGLMFVAMTKIVFHW